MENILINVARISVLLLALVLHEIAHGLVAYWNGDPTAKNSGRISFNPMKHFDMVGFLMLAFLRFGYAKPVPVNPYNFKRRKFGIFTVSIAGVTVNLFLAFIFTPVLMVMPYPTNYLGLFLYYFVENMVFINLFLCIFNLLPIYPLDGFRVVESLTRYNNPYTRFMRNYGQYILFGLIFLSVMTTMLPAGYASFDILFRVLRGVAGFVINLFTRFWGLII